MGFGQGAGGRWVNQVSVASRAVEIGPQLRAVSLWRTSALARVGESGGDEGLGREDLVRASLTVQRRVVLTGKAGWDGKGRAEESRAELGLPQKAE